MDTKWMMIAAVVMAAGMCGILLGGVSIWWAMGRQPGFRQTALAAVPAPGGQAMRQLSTPTPQQPTANNRLAVSEARIAPPEIEPRQAMEQPDQETEHVRSADQMEGREPQATAAVSAVPPRYPTSEPPSISTRSVYINGQRIPDQDVQMLELAYHVPVTDGNYWYDRMTGAWGREGGPCLGVIAAQLNLGGKLQANASNGDTGVYVNGRQLHRLDVLRLMQLGPVLPGRYWMDAQGSFGFEGGPMIGNLHLAAAAPNGNGRGGAGASARHESVLTTWDRTGVAVYGY